MQGRALVLGGGGVTGIGWELGLLAGLCERGVDLREADVVVGTSAGSVSGVHVAARVDLAASYAQQLEPPTSELRPRFDMVALARLGLVLARPGDRHEVARRVGALALRARTVPEGDRIDVISARLPVLQWPAGRLQVTAVDAATGELVVFDASGDAPLVDAVTASCAVPGVWPPVTILGRRYIDGAVGSVANVELARGFEQVVVIAPVTNAGRAFGRPQDEVRSLRDSGAAAVLVTPDEASRAAAGRNALDPRRRAPSARAGYAQAEAEAERVAEVWHLG